MGNATERGCNCSRQEYRMNESVPPTLNCRYTVPPPWISTVMIKQTPRSRAESEFVRELQRSRSPSGSGSHQCLPPLPVEPALPYPSTYAQPRELCKTRLVAQVCSDQSNPLGWMTQTCLFSVASGILDVTEVGLAEINGCVDTRSRVLVFRF